MSATNDSSVTFTKQTSSSSATKSEPGESTSSEVDTCVVCFKNVEIYSIGECDHPVCHECSTRMRVLCQQNECPICRQVLGKVIFTYDKLPYRELEAKNRSEYYNKRYKIGFYTNDIQKRFFELLDHPCPKCNTLPYRSFQGLRDHVRREHNLHFCDLCVDHLKIFTFERRCYTQAELNQHRTKGDPDNKSHRGHPLCEYCNKRFLDRDELFRHLRREHYFCHFCDDAHGCNEFYRDYEALAQHFRQDHYLCEEGKCATEKFIGAFRSEIDYKAHIASVHGKTLNKQQAKQTRTLQLEITLGPRGRGGQAESNITSTRTRGHENINEEEDNTPSYTQQLSQQRPVTIDSQNEQDFPSLGGGSSAPVQPLMPFPMRRGLPGGLARTKENFPALGGSGGGNNAAVTSQRGSKQQSQGPPISSMLKKSTTTSKSAAQSTSDTASSNNMVLHVSNRPSANSRAFAKQTKTPGMDFPALPSAASTSSKAFPSLSLSGKNKKQQNHAQNHQQQQHQQQHSRQQQQQARLLDEDMLPPTTNTAVPVGMVASKHRTLVDDYVSVANPKNFQKIQMVQQEQAAAERAAAAERTKAPKLTSEEFPSLGGGSSNASNGASSNWMKPNTERKQRELENRKAKVAPAPLLKINQQQQQNQTNVPNKDSKENQHAPKDKKSKDKKNEASNNQNQLTKAQSKLKEKNNNNENKFNSNGSSNGALKTATNSLPNGHEDNNTQLLRPPPGFQKLNDPPIDSASKLAPPGFISNVTVNSVAKSPNSLTFTSSMGDNYSIVAKHNYSQLPDSPRRNQKLGEDFQNAMNSYECYKEFHLISHKFREGLYKPAAFYEHCQVALKDKFDELFPELLALLPDISKQQALYLIHVQRLNTMPAEERKSLPEMMVCSVCGQVVLTQDVGAHQKSHEFPQLIDGHAKAATSGKRK